MFAHMDDAYVRHRLRGCFRLEVQTLDFHDHGEEDFRRRFVGGARTHRRQLKGTGLASPQG